MKVTLFARWNYLALIIAMFCSLSSYAQPCNLTNSLNISTGSNGSGGIISIGSQDPYWKVTSLSSHLTSMAPFTPPYAPYAVTPHGAWAASGSSRYLSFITANGYNTTTTGIYEMTITREFRTCGDDTYNLSFSFAGDDTIKSVVIDNTTTIYTNPGTWNGGSFSSPTTTSLPLSAGTHTISVTLANWRQNYTANDNYFGVNVSGSITSATSQNTIVTDNSHPRCECIQCPELTNLTICNDIIANPLKYTFTPTFNPAGTSYNIYFGDGNSQSSVSGSAVHTYATGGSYTITIEILMTYANGEVTICDRKEFTICVPGGSDGEGKRESNRTMDLNTPELTYVADPYPNPANSAINVPVSGNENPTEAVIVSADGKIVARKNQKVSGKGVLKFDTSKLPPGVYYIKITDATGHRVRSISIL